MNFKIILLINQKKIFKTFFQIKMDKENLNIINDFIKYNSAIINFENKIKEIYCNINKENNKGYLINLKDFNEFKEIINYDKYKIFGLRNKDDYIKYIDLNKCKKIKKVKQIKINTSQYLINMIFNDNKYIIINENLWNIICDKEENYPIFYDINADDLSFNFKNENKLYFKNNKNNIIDKNSYNYSKNNSNYTSNINEIKNIYNDIKNIL